MIDKIFFNELYNLYVNFFLKIFLTSLRREVYLSACSLSLWRGKVRWNDR